MALAQPASGGWPNRALVAKSDLVSFVASLMERFPVIAPVAKGPALVFSEISDPGEVQLAYRSTILPPRKFFQRPREEVLSFSPNKVEAAPVPDTPRVLLGVHPCDVEALKILDTIYTNGYVDPYYHASREQTYIIALNCTTQGENCFCVSLDTGPGLKDGYDLVLTDLGREYLVEAGSVRGQELLGELGLELAPRAKVVEKESKIEAVRRSQPRQVEVRGLRDLLARGVNHPVWGEVAEECLSCGSCTMVCPTCFCYWSKDEVNLDLASGSRVREWDSCQFWEYALVALGHNFRPEREARVRQRIYHKFFYSFEQSGGVGCVGCGRCLETCVKNISITEILGRLKEE